MTDIGQWAVERSSENRFGFGANWLTFLGAIDDRRINEAENSIRTLLGIDDLKGCRFLDAGCGSGLFSLAAAHLGADVVSFDVDLDSVRCTVEVQRRFGSSDTHWRVVQGSVLDLRFLATLGACDVVYSWGVLHHTGHMWQALENVSTAVAARGRLGVAIYNDQGLPSRVWLAVKKTYNVLPPPLRFVVLWPSFVRLWGPTLVRDLFKRKPMRTWSSYYTERGMSPLVDLRDWVGGYPFEVASPDKVERFCAARGLSLDRLIRREGRGCNEFAFTRIE